MLGQLLVFVVVHGTATKVAAREVSNMSNDNTKSEKSTVLYVESRKQTSRITSEVVNSAKWTSRGS